MTQLSSCPDRQILALLLDPRTKEEDVAPVEEHVLACETCCQVLRELESADTFVEAARGTQASLPADGEVQRVIAGLKAAKAPQISSAAALDETLASKCEATEDAWDLGTLLDPPEGESELGRFGGYRVLRVLGSGGMGLVFEAEDPKLRRRVALKVMKRALASKDEHHQRFLREARAAAAIEHPHIVTVYQVGEHKGIPFLAMQLLKGESLDERLRRQREDGLPRPSSTHGDGLGRPSSVSGTLPLEEVLRIGRETAEALAEAHQRNLIHRDIKPANIWLEGASGWVKLVDFGLAHAAEDVHLTQTGMILGTPAYMSPEQARGDAVDGRTDLYSLGVVLYRLTTGDVPFRGTSTMALLMALATETPRPPRELNPEMPSALDDLIIRLLAKKPDDRFESAAAVVAAIRTIEQESLSSKVESPKSDNGVERRRPRWPLVLAAAAAALILAAIVIIVRDKDGNELARVTVDGGASAEVLADDAASKSAAPAHDGIPSRGPQEQPAPEPPSAAANLRERPNPLDRRELRSYGLWLDHLPPDVPLVARLGDPRLGERWELRSVAYSSDGNLLAAAGFDKLVLLHNTKSWEVVQTLRGHTAIVTALAFHPKDNLLASSSAAEIKLWDADTGEERLTLPGRGGTGAWHETDSVVFIREGTQLAAAAGAAIKFYSTQTGELVKELKGGPGAFTQLSLSADGSRLAACSAEDMNVRIWSLNDDKEPLVVKYNVAFDRAQPYALAFHPNGKTIAVGGWGWLVGTWDAETGDFVREFESPHYWNEGAPIVSSLAFSPDGETLMAGGRQANSQGGYIDRWETSTGKALPPIWTPGQNAAPLAFSPDGRALAVALRGYGAGCFHGGEDYVGQHYEEQFQAAHQVSRTIVLDPVDGRSLVPASGHGAPASALCFGPDGAWLASAGYDAAVHVWDMHRLETTRSLTLPHDVKTLFNNTFGSLAASPDGQWLAASAGTKEVRLWELATRGEPLVLPAACFSHNALAFSPDSRLLATGAAEHVLRLWNIASGKEQTKLTGQADEVRAVAFSPDGKTLASGGKGATVNFWDVAAGREVGTCAGTGGDVVALGFIDNTRVAVGMSGGDVRLRDVPSGEAFRTLRAPESSGELTALAVQPGGERVVTAHADSTVRLWNVESGQMECSFVLAVDAMQVFHLAFTPEGRYLAAALADGTILLLRLEEAETAPAQRDRSNGPSAAGQAPSPPRTPQATMGDASFRQPKDVAEPPPLEEWLKGREVLTVAQDGSGKFKTIQAAVNALKPHQVVKVLDTGPYREVLEFGDLPYDTGLISQQQATIETPTRQDTNEGAAESRHHLGPADGFRLSGLSFVAPPHNRWESGPILECWRVSGMVIEDCRFGWTAPPDGKAPYGAIAFYAEEGDTNDSPVVLRQCVFDSAAVYLPALATFVIERNLFRDTIIGFEGPMRKVLIRQNVFARKQERAVVDMKRIGDIAEVVEIANNTVQGGNFTVREGAPKKGIVIRNNITSRGVSLDSEANTHRADILENWRIDHNSYPRLGSLPAATSDVTQDAGFLSTRGNDRDYLRISADSTLATAGAGGDLPTYVGALPPGPAPKEGDWFTRLRERWQASPTPNASLPRETIDVLATLDLSKDLVPVGNLTGANNWTKAENKLTYHSDGRSGKIVAPIDLADARDYEIQVDVRRLSGNSVFTLDFPTSAALGSGLDVYIGGQIELKLENGERHKIGEWPSDVKDAGQVVMRVRQESTNRPGSVEVAVNNQRVAHWEGNVSRIGNPLESHPAFPGRMTLGLFCFQDSYEFTGWQLRVYDGHAQPLRADSRR